VLSTITNPQRFADWFNETVPGAYREITAEDVRLLIEYGLICRYRYYSDNDIHTVIGILNYEQERGKRTERKEKAVMGVQLCKGCSMPLPSQEVIKKGRHKEYCSNCEPLRLKNRYSDWKKKHYERVYANSGNF
jgi:hypothetical protein